MEKLKMNSEAVGRVVANPDVPFSVRVGGRFKFEIIREGKVVDSWEDNNTITNEGMNYLLDCIFGGEDVEAAWYVGIYTASAGAFADLTGAMVGGVNLTEFTNYVDNRKAFSGIRSNYTWTNAATKASFAITHAGTIKGAFLVNKALGIPDYLLAINSFATGDRTLAPADTLNVTYIFGMQNA